MRSLVQFLSDLRAAGVTLSVSGERLVCNAPKQAMTADIRTELAARKAEIITFLRQTQVWTAPQRNSDLAEELPLSRVQQMAWFLAQYDPETPLFNINIPLWLNGTLDRSALEAALKTVIERHESLRTGFFHRQGKPYARIIDARDWEMHFVDLTHLAEPEAEAEAKGLAYEAARWLFDLEKAPLIRATLFHISRQRYLLVIVIQHIVADGWSLGILFREMTELYAAIVRGQPSPLPALTLNYRDYVQWELEAGRDAADEQMKFWLERLSGSLPVLELPLDRPRPPKQSYRGRATIIGVEPGIGEGLRKLGRQSGTTLFVVLLSVFKILLLRYTGLDDIVLGTSATIRPRQEFASLIGFFINMVVVRSDLSTNPTFPELLARVNETTRSAYANQNVSFAELVGVLRPQRSLSQNPIVQAVFNLQNVPLPKLSLPGLEIDYAEIDRGLAGGDLMVLVWPEGDGYRCDFSYNTDLFDEETMDQLKSHYVRLLKEVVADPTRRIGELPLLSEEERLRITRDWNRTESQGSSYKTVPEWFRARAKVNSDAIAVTMGEQTLTYGQLDAQSEVVSDVLRGKGVRRDTVVGLYLHRGPQMIVALLGILKAGGAYLPVDPALPAKRIEFLLGDAGVSFVLTRADLADTLPQNAAQILDYDRMLAGGDRSLSAESEDSPSAADIAYLIYTSGSTGEPKGTEIPHSALVNLLWSMMRAPGLQSSDVLVAVTTLSFDIAGLEIFGPLLCGAKLVLASREQALDPRALGEVLEQAGATVMQATPSTWRMLVDDGWLGNHNLRIWCGGEALLPGLADRLLERGRELWNLYGPTETTIWSAVHRVSSGEDPILIGRPVANTRMYILDGRGEPAPIGVTGELYIAGAGVARGYRNRPELTKERFLPDTFAGVGRMYRTGDLARYRRDGQIQLLGRTDQQVKLRGHRIELGEIETALEGLGSVQQAVVTVREEGAAQHLVAYVRPAAETPEVSELRSLLEERLPEYMVPGTFVFLDQLPLSANGKVDRKRLPAPSREKRERATEVQRPRNASEELIANAWSQVLKQDVIGVQDNFFDLGGQSLMAVQVLAILREKLDIRIDVVDLFRYPTVRSLAAHLDRQARQEASAGVCP